FVGQPDLSMVLLDAYLIRDRLARHNHDTQGVEVGFFSGSAQAENSEGTVVMIEYRGCRTGQIVVLFKVVFAANDLNRQTKPEGKSDRPCSRLFFPPHST